MGGLIYVDVPAKTGKRNDQIADIATVAVIKGDIWPQDVFAFLEIGYLTAQQGETGNVHT